MSTVKKGTLTASGTWRKHLRKDWRRFFWKRERAAEKQQNSEHLRRPVDDK